EYNEDIDIFISQLSSYLVGTGIDLHANQDQAFGILRRCLYGNPSIAHNYANTASNNAITVGVSIILAKAFTKDWCLAGRQPSDRPVNAINAGLSPNLEDDTERIGTEQLLANLLKFWSELK
ncbi:13234_t:CDS:2, partial [Racocetra persica]